ncbi:MAG: hypothetical protein QM796_20980 [Chthoniobacteraceae bacterium]
MHSLKLLTLILGVLGLSIFTAHAQGTLNAFPVTITGTISQPENPSADPSPTKVIAITKASLLKLSGNDSVAPSNTDFFVTSDGSVVLASKDQNTTYLTVLAYGDALSWNPSKKKTIGGGSVSLLDSNLGGTATYTQISAGKYETETDQIAAYGTYNGVTTTLRATFIVKSPLQ